VPLAERGQAEAVAVLGVDLAADAHRGHVDDAQHRGEHAVAIERAAPQLSAHVRTDPG